MSSFVDVSLNVVKVLANVLVRNWRGTLKIEFHCSCKVLEPSYNEVSITKLAIKLIISTQVVRSSMSLHMVITTKRLRLGLRVSLVQESPYNFGKCPVAIIHQPCQRGIDLV